MQRHHLLPKQLLTQKRFGRLFDRIDRDRLCFDDFRSNGLLLPAVEDMALLMGLPLHRGPHRKYSEMVAERVGQIEQGWSKLFPQSAEHACAQAVMRLELLQKGLRRRLLAAKLNPFKLNRKDPIGKGVDFAELDAMADSLWTDTKEIEKIVVF